MDDGVTDKQLINRLNELEEIAEAMAKAVEFYQYEYSGEAYAHPAVIRFNQYRREYYHPRPAAVKQSGAAR